MLKQHDEIYVIFCHEYPMCSYSFEFSPYIPDEYYHKSVPAIEGEEPGQINRGTEQ